MANILETITELLKSSLGGQPSPPLKIQGLAEDIQKLMAVSVDASGTGIDRWIGKLKEIAKDVPLRETLVVRALQMHLPRLAETLTLLGVIGFKWGTDKTIPLEFSINWDKLNKYFSTPGDEFLTLLLTKVQSLDDLKALQVLLLLLFSGPQALLSLEYRQQGFSGLPLKKVPGVTSDELIELIQNLIRSPLSIPIPFTPPLTLDEFKAKTIAANEEPKPASLLTIDSPTSVGDFNQLKGLALEIKLADVQLSIKESLDLGAGWRLGFATSDTGPQTYRLEFQEKGLNASIKNVGTFGISLSKKPVDGSTLLIGEKNGTHFSIQNISLGLQLRNKGPLFDYQVKLDPIEFALKPDFLKFLSFGLNLPTLLRFDSNVFLNYLQGKGLSGQGSEGGLPALGVQFATPLNLKIGTSSAGISIDQVTTRLEVKLGTPGLYFRTIFRYGARATFGPLKTVLDGAGVWIGRWTDGNGGLLPPQGIGLSLDAGPVSGGGFLKIINDQEFGGALQLKIMGVGAFAYGLYKKMPTGEISFVALIGIRLPTPGIQIGFGFAVSGFGGLVGINRRADTDLIRQRLGSGTTGEVLFNDDPMKNAPKLLGDMQLFFPDAAGVFLIGPTLQINWLSLLKLDVGVFIEFPGPRKIFIAGTAKLVIGSEEHALVFLRMDFIGGVDIAKSLIFFDAALVNSHVLGIFRITGGVALRIGYGENGYFLFSVGGFHPSFNPGSMELPQVPRVGVSYSVGPVWVKMEMYLAVTSNTFQMGSKVEAGIRMGPIAAHGWFAFDALIQFKPFYFVGRIDAGFDVEVKGISLCSVHVTGELSGPGPLMLRARASVRVLFVKVSGDVTVELSSNPPEQLVPIENIPKYLQEKGELSKPENLRAEGEDPSVVFAPSPDGVKLFSPVGKIIWEQKRVPLNLPIEKMEGVDLGGWHTLVPATTMGFAPEQDWFGVGTYLKLADGEALNNPRFAAQQSGMQIGDGSLSRGKTAPATLETSLVKLPKRTRFLDVLGNVALFSTVQYVNAGLSGVLSERINGAKPDLGPAQVTVAQEAWSVHTSGGKAMDGSPLNPVQAFIKAKQTGGIALPSSEKELNLTGVI